jgi:hypothetical protein
MKKIFLLAVCCLFLGTSVCSAEITRGLAGTCAKISSYKKVFDADGEWLETFSCDRRRYINVMSSLETMALTVVFPQEHPQNKFVRFTMKKLPTFEVTSANGTYTFSPKKIKYMHEHMVWFDLKKDAVAKLAEADKVMIVFPSADTEPRQVPPEILSEWKKVLATDMKELRKELSE